MRYFFYLLLYVPLSLSACSCVFTSQFCDYTEAYLEWSPDSTVVMRARLLEYRTPDVNGFFPLYDYEVLEVLVGEFDAPMVSLLGQDGANCNGPWAQVRAGEEYIVMFSNRKNYFSAYGIRNFSNPYPIHDYPGCGDATLALENGLVSGPIADGVTRLNLDAFKDQLGGCIGEELLNAGPFGNLLSYEATVRPNPASEIFLVTFTEATPVFALQLFDVAGRLVSEDRYGGQEIMEHRVNVSDLPAGVYQLIVKTDGLWIKKRVVVI